MPLFCRNEYYTNDCVPERGLSDKLSEYFSIKQMKSIVFLCIGTDRATGDALGPLVGTYLTDRGIENVFGTVDKPVHAENLNKYIRIIKNSYRESLVIAVDASLGKTESVGTINIREGALYPGSGVSKILGSVGDISITGVVNKMTFNPMFQLQNTRLSLVMNMAKTIGRGICNSLSSKTSIY